MRVTVPSAALAIHTDPPPPTTALGLLPTAYWAVMCPLSGSISPMWSSAMPGRPSSPSTRMSPNASRPAIRNAAAPNSSCRVRGGGCAPRLGLVRPGQVERRVVGEDRVVQVLQLGARLDPDLVDERVPRVAVGLERLRLAAGAIQREHPLGVQVLAQRIRSDERVELPDHVGVAALREIGVDRALRRTHAQLLEPADLGGRERLVGEVGERISVPERERVARARLAHQPLEAHGVDVALGQLQLVAAAVGHDSNAVAVEDASEMRHVVLHHLRGARRQLVTPQALGETIRRHRPARLQGEHREYRPLLAGAQLDGAIPEANLERPQQPHDHRGATLVGAVTRVNH